MDKIRIIDLEVFANHGVFPEENKLGQKFLISAELSADTRKAGKTDDLAESIDYGKVSHFIASYMKEHTFQLLESVAEHLAEELLLHTEHLQAVKLEIKKPWAPIGLPVAYASVQVERKWHQVFVALGSNMGERKSYLENAIAALDDVTGCKVKNVSFFRETEPYGMTEQERFLNGCLELDTLLTPEELLEELHRIEAEAGRERVIHWGPRTLDLDILFYDDQVVETMELCIPHADMQNREFVLGPLAEIAPYKRHPVYGWTIKEQLEKLQKSQED